jgi:aspartate/methionine/tyrosine aminotransferase/methylase of polypeptide subunit release factors
MRVKVPDIALYLEERAITFEELQTFVDALENPSTRLDACAALHTLAAELSVRDSENGLRLFEMPIPGCDEGIKLFLHPAVFEPEQWGKTFAEGLLKEPEVFSGKSIVELGTGSGWISILLLKRTYARFVLGLDLNPVAVAISKLNGWLNGCDADGTLKMTLRGAPLVESFRVAHSDLLLEPLGRRERFDHVIGCIPQVLHPDPAQLKSKRKMSTRDLYDLSNYCFQQGILEDRFGLPLIARALEQAQLCLNPGGSVMLILGGRPGIDAIDGVFRRRGYEPQLWWSRRIQQADDTDLASLVALEREHGIKFHFYASFSSKHSIPASTAVGLLSYDRPLYHDLLVMQAQTRHEKPMLTFVKNINALGLGAMRKELDLSQVTDEQISFLSRLTQELLHNRTLPYPHERGDAHFRERVAKFLQTYCNFTTTEDRLFIGPERSQLLFCILSMVARPGDKVLLSSSLHEVYSDVLSRLNCEPVLGNDDLPELVELDDLFAPKISILAPHEMADPSTLVMDAFVRQAKAHPDRWYLIDDSANFDIASALRANVMMRILSQQDLPPNLVFLYGLIKNTVSADLELSFMLNAPQQWIEGLDVAAELTYSRIAHPTQLYYEWLFDELLAFPFPDEAKEPIPIRTASADLSPWFKEIAADPVFLPKPIDPEERGVLRLDYGEFEAPVPAPIVKGLVKGFLEPGSSAVADVVPSRVAAYLKFTRHVTVTEDRIVLGQGVFPLLAALVEGMRHRLGRPPLIAMPNGSYGPIYSLIAYHGGIVVPIETDPEQGFLATLQSIARMHETKPDLLWLTQPNNPSGLFFESDTVAGIMQLCAERGIYVLADEIFFLLSDPKIGTWTNPQLSFCSTLPNAEGKWLFVVDGLSKAFAAGGLRAGFMVCPDAAWADEIQNLTVMPPKTTLRAWDGLYSVFLDEAPHNMMDIGKEQADVLDYLTNARVMLQEQREKLYALLTEFGRSDNLEHAKRGALFMLGRFNNAEATALAKQKGLLINPPDWARTPGWSRVCFSLEPARFNIACERLREFLNANRH